MAQAIDLPGNGLVALTRESLIALRTALFRDVGPSAAAALQEAGYAGGQVLYDALGQWLEGRGLPAAESLAAAEFGHYVSEFFQDAGWGSVALGALDTVATLDSANWAESDPDHPLDFPGCYYTAGMMSDLFGRLAGEPLAVMEVECRSMGADRCRWLIGSAETMQRVYDSIGQGESYEVAIGVA